jgi:dCMP deaminase
MKKAAPVYYKEKLKRWDHYFHDVCVAVGENTVCMSRKIGAVFVLDKSIISTGYNGPPRGVPHCNERYKIDPEMRAYLDAKDIDPDHADFQNQCPRQVMGFKSGEGLQWCVAGHAERNAIVNAARNGISTKGTKLYMSCGVPCSPCLVEIINAGIEEIIITKLTFYDASARYLLESSGLKFRIFSHLKEE